MVKPIIHCPVHFGPSVYGMNILETGWSGLNWWNETSGSGSCSELDNSSWLLGTISSAWDKKLFPWAEFVVALGIMGLWINGYRTLPMSTKTLPESSYMQAGNFCSEHCSYTIIFTHSDSEAVLSCLELWIYSCRTLPSIDKEQYLLYKLCTSLSDKSHSASYESN